MKQKLPDTRLGMNPDTKAFEKWLAKTLAKENPDKKAQGQIFNLIGWWTGIAFIVSGILFAIISGAIGNFRIDIFTALFTTGAVLAVMFGILWLQTRKSNAKNYQQVIPGEVYNKFWELCYAKKIPLTFSGINDKQNDVFEFHTPTGEKIVWQTYQTTNSDSMRTTVNVLGENLFVPGLGNELNLKTAFVLHAELIAYSPKLKDCEGVFLTKRNSLDSPINGDEYDLASASMSFNKKFKVTVFNKDQQAASRIFDPSVVQYFDEMTYISGRFDFLEFHDGYVMERWRDMVRSKNQANECINDFTNLQLTAQNATKMITKKIKHDYEWFFANYAILSPFELYPLSK